MTIAALPMRWLRDIRRAYKFVILMFAAWAPVALPRHPFVAAAILLSATVLFLLATRSEPVPISSECEPREQIDATP
jgi:hypothetical protein